LKAALSGYLSHSGITLTAGSNVLPFLGCSF
jgi:hypothetical protein